MTRQHLSPVADPGPRLLAVGMDRAAARQFADAGDLACLPFDAVTADRLAALRPDLVLSPLVCREFDSLELAERLVEAGFRGRYRAAVQRVPNPALVRREIAERFPGLDFDLMILDETGRAQD